MKITVFANGKEFTSKITNDLSVEYTKTQIYNMLETTTKFELETEDGFVIFAPDAIKNAIIMVTEK